MKAVFTSAAGRLALVPIVALVLFYFLTSPTAGNFWWYDSSRHAMNGVFLRDLLVEGGLFNPVRFATQYYEQYPAVNIGFYPPFFYISSVPLLLLFGASHAVSQSVVALYALGLGTLTWLVSRRAMDPLGATVTALAVLALAPVALWSRQVQLDVPAVAVYFFTAYALVRHLESGHQGWLFGAAVAVGVGMLTRVQGVFMVPVLLFFLFGPRYAQRPPFARRALATVLAGLIALPAVVMVAYFQKVNAALATATPGMPKLWSVENWTWYAEKLPEQVGWPALALMIAGLLATVWLGFKGRLPVALKVLAACGVCAWVFFSVVSNKDPRFNLPSVLFLFVLAANGLYLLVPAAARLLLALLAGWLLFQLSTLGPVPEVNGFREAAAITQQITPKDANVLISAHRDGSFIYDMRTQGTRRDIGVRRGDKLFVELHIMRELGIRDRQLDKAAILAMLDRARVATVVMQPGYLADQPTIRNFQALLDDGTYYDKVGTVAMGGNTDRDEHALLVYRRKAVPAPGVPGK
jgi:4-amino-4-deoxy-L-arabinose transferase-like glycosyltransferase